MAILAEVGLAVELCELLEDILKVSQRFHLTITGQGQRIFFGSYSKEVLPEKEKNATNM